MFLSYIRHLHNICIFLSFGSPINTYFPVHPLPWHFLHFGLGKYPTKLFSLEELLQAVQAIRTSGAIAAIKEITEGGLQLIEENLRLGFKLWKERFGPSYRALIFGEGIKYVEAAPGMVHLEFPTAPSSYGPHPTEEGLRPLYERVAGALKYAPAGLRIRDIYAFNGQKDGAAQLRDYLKSTIRLSPPK